MKKDKESLFGNDFILRYSKRSLFYGISYGGTLLTTSSCLLLKNTDWDSFFKQFGFIENDVLMVFVLIGIIIFTVFVFLFPFFLALRITDKKCIVRFHEEYLEIRPQNKTIRINYDEIERIKFVNVKNGSRGIYYTSSTRKIEYGWSSSNGGFGPYMYRAIIYTAHKKYKIHCSFKEAWQCRKQKIDPTLYHFIKKLERESNLKAEYTINTWR